MRIRDSILLICALAWSDPASAKVYQLTVSIHEAVSMTQNDVKDILKRASNLLHQKPNSCDIEFKLKGITHFASPPPADIIDEMSLEQVQNVPGDVKVVRSIKFCVGKNWENGVFGCSWRPDDHLPRTVIVTPPPHDGSYDDEVLWAHEFGHTRGLPHRTDDPDALMQACISPDHTQVNKSECRHFLAGPPNHYPPPSSQCSALSGD